MKNLKKQQFFKEFQIKIIREFFNHEISSEECTERLFDMELKK